jgi:hypothetical protein
MFLNADRLRYNGFDDDEINQIEEHIVAAIRDGHLNERSIAAYSVNDHAVIRSVLDIFRKLRSERWTVKRDGLIRDVIRTVRKELRRKFSRRKP